MADMPLCGFRKSKFCGLFYLIFLDHRKKLATQGVEVSMYDFRKRYPIFGYFDLFALRIKFLPCVDGLGLYNSIWAFLKKP